MIDPRTPVLVGVGQVNEEGQDAPEPIDLLVEAARRAITDSGGKHAVAAISSVRVVKLLSWRYSNPAALVAERLGATTRHTSYSTDGGHTPQAMLNKAALDIQAGLAVVIVMGGADSWRTRMAYRQRGERPPWIPSGCARRPADCSPSMRSASTRPDLPSAPSRCSGRICGHRPVWWSTRARPGRP